ncbi:hypothetical protein F8M41_021983 [Gigaspora margarita]|uniref:Uncharacterized protein n=1 Tax=Gigaspora margarita TaxID=4874 RepID=A0A8H4AFX5_GIGMA|nr:hypothetical protein F8M41_021983 [Gigaspora margarita]
MRCECSEHCVKVSKNKRTNINIRDEWKKRKNNTYLDDNVDAGFLQPVDAKDERKFSTYHQRTAEMNTKCMEVNRKFVKASIRTILSLNMMNVKYIKSKEFNWRCLNKEPAVGHIDDGIVEYVPSAEVDVDGVKVGEAADGKANDPKNRIGCQYKNRIDIGKNKEKAFINYQKSSAIRNISNHGRCDEKNK